MGDSLRMLKNAVIISFFVIGAFIIGTSAEECSEECQAKGGTCFWKKPGRDYKKIGACAVGEKGEGQVCSCGLCYVKKEEGGGEPTCKKSKSCKRGKCLGEDEYPEGDNWEQDSVATNIRIVHPEYLYSYSGHFQYPNI